MILPFPLIITVALFSVCFISFSPPGSGKTNNSSSETNRTNGKLNEGNLSDSVPPPNAGKESQTPEHDDSLNYKNINESTEPKGTSMSILFGVQFMICIFFLYDCYFNFVFHLPVRSFLVSVLLATAVRVQCLLLMVSLHVLPKEIISSLAGMCEPQPSSKYQCPKQIVHSDYFLKFFHIMRFRTLKHKRQNLFLKSNWRSVLNRISNFQLKNKTYACTDKGKQPEENESNNMVDNSMLKSIQTYVVFCICV